ncbi:hypothetical protein Enr17x_19370 [Gimesia fumaroli]|uniref:Uncharacterized protein n=1 Tax=Gimesia fumaroli TaxID=2527976 RepID=A0A518I9W4_9PLAN|nr:hypothetical protein Enr17x_19370 [Gimesia fumaroli]
MISLMEVFGSLMILFVIVLFSHRQIKRSADRKNKENRQDGESGQNSE